MANALIELSALNPSDEEVAAKTFGVSNRLDKWAAKWPREFAFVLVRYQEIKDTEAENEETENKGAETKETKE